MKVNSRTIILFALSLAFALTLGFFGGRAVVSLVNRTESDEPPATEVTQSPDIANQPQESDEPPPAPPTETPESTMALGSPAGRSWGVSELGGVKPGGACITSPEMIKYSCLII